MKQKEKTFREYLFDFGHSDKTIKSYLYAVGNYKSVCPGADKFRYKDVLNYMGDRTEDYKNSGAVTAILSAIKKYYDYLIEIGRREDQDRKSVV